MAVVVSNKTQDFNYHVRCIQSFLMECGRVQAVLSNTVVQSDQAEHLISLYTESNSSKAWKQHYSSTITSILITITRKCWKIPQNTNGTSQNTESTTWNKLRHQHHKPTPNYTMACTTHSLPAQQICNTCRWQHRLLQKMEQRTSNTTMWVRRNSPLSTTTCEGPTKTRKQISPSNLAWQRHSNRRNTPWHSNNGCTFQNNQEATNAREVQQTVDGHHQQQRTERVPNGHCSVLWLGASALGEGTWCHCWVPLQGAHATLHSNGIQKRHPEKLPWASCRRHTVLYIDNTKIGFCYLGSMPV